MKKQIILLVFSVVILSAIVIAATLQWEREVLTCSDSDGGLNFNITGTASGLTLTGMNYSYTDFCTGQSTVNEYACSSNNGTFLQLWQQDCSTFGLDCCNGHCGKC